MPSPRLLSRSSKADFVLPTACPFDDERLVREPVESGRPLPQADPGGETSASPGPLGRIRSGLLRSWSDTRFLDAHRLYERLGYVRTGETRDLHDLSNTTEFFFVKELESGRAAGAVG